MRKIIALTSTLLFLTIASVKAEMQFGFGLMTGQLVQMVLKRKVLLQILQLDQNLSKNSFLVRLLWKTFLTRFTVGLSLVPIDIE